MEGKVKSIGLRIADPLAGALEAYCRKEERSLSGAVRYLLMHELERLGYLQAESLPKRSKTRKAGHSPSR